MGILKLARKMAVTVPEADEAAATSGSRLVDDLSKLIKTRDTFCCVYADPPWRYENQGTRGSADNHYPTLSIADLHNLSVAKLAAPNAHLHLWVPSSFLLDAAQHFDAWGFIYKISFVWVKPQMGRGNYWRLAHEFLLLGMRGRLPFR